MTNELTTQPAGSFSLAPRNLQEALQLADMLAASELVPKDYRGKPGNVLVAVQWGAEVGLKPLQALQNIAVINGRPSLWGDAVIALVRNSALCEYIVETWDAAGTAVCQVKRRGEQEQVRSFSDADAKTAGLFGKEGPWKTNPKRMKQMRARAFALRDVFADVLKGIAIAEEVMDLPVEHTAAPIQATVVEVPPELLAAGKEAADKGVKAYAAWFESIGKINRLTVQHEHDAWKQRAAEQDAARAAGAATATSAAAPETTTAASAEQSTDDFLAALDAADAKAEEPNAYAKAKGGE